MKKTLSLLLLAFVLTTANAQQDTTWFDSLWKKTTPDKAMYYRPQPQPKDSGYWAVDYYISGKKQYEAFSTTQDSLHIEGLATWYREDGSVSQTAEYTNGTQNGKFTSYLTNGQKNEAEYRDGYLFSGTIIYEDENIIITYRAINGQLEFSKTNKKGRVNTGFEIYYKNGMAVKHISYNEKENKAEIAEYDSLNWWWNGTIINYYKDLSPSSNTIYKKGEPERFTSFYQNGAVRQAQTLQGNQRITNSFNKKGVITATLIEEKKDGVFTPQSGKTFIFANEVDTKSDSTITTIFQYNNGHKVRVEYFNTEGVRTTNETYNTDGLIVLVENFDEQGNFKSKLTYDPETQEPIDGTLIFDNSTKVYENKQIVSETELYDNGKPFKIRANNSEVFYTRQGEQLGTLTLYDKYNYGKAEDPFNGNLFEWNGYHITGSKYYVQGNLSEEIYYYSQNTDQLTNKKKLQYDKEGNLVTEESYFIAGPMKANLTYADSEPIIGYYYDKTGNKVAEYNFKDRNGIEYIYFDDSDQVKSITTRKDGVAVYEKVYSEIHSYDYENPSQYYLYSEIDYYKKGQFYDKDGKMLYEAEYRNGQPYQGKVIVDDGYSSIVTSYEKGVIEGEQLTYDSYSKALKEKRNFKNGLAQGLTILYSNGKVLKETPYVNDTIEGEVHYYNYDGQKVSSLTYSANAPQNGIKTEFEDDNGYYQQTTYINGEETKILKYENNSLIIKKVLEADNSFKVEHYFINRKISFSYNEYGSLLHGKVIAFDEYGKKLYEGKVNKGVFESGVLFIAKDSYRYDQEETVYYKFFLNSKERKLVGIDEKKQVSFELKENINKEGMIKNLINYNELTFYNLYVKASASDEIPLLQ